MITQCTACIAYITALMFCIGAKSMDLDAQSRNNRPHIDISDDLSLLLPDLSDVQGNFYLINFSYELGRA
jgi:hypothetical protein